MEFAEALQENSTGGHIPVIVRGDAEKIDLVEVRSL